MQNQANNQGKTSAVQADSGVPSGQSSPSGRTKEPEFVGSIWRHPYMVYVYLTAVIFGAMIFIGWMALEQGWIPSRG